MRKILKTCLITILSVSFAPALLIAEQISGIIDDVYIVNEDSLLMGELLEDVTVEAEGLGSDITDENGNYTIPSNIVVPDNDLPPVYGPSQVCDFEQDINSLDFTVKGNSEDSEGISSLELYYRHSEDNELWSEWILYDTDTDSSDGWSWTFNSPDGAGYYQFYSIRIVEHGEIIEYEKIPDGPDSKVRVIIK